MKQSDSKQLFFTVWAANADPNTLRQIPQKASEATEAGAASLEKGFTATNMTPVAAGGVPPFGQDFNGILNYLSRAAQLIEMGLVPGWSKSFSDAIGGYPQNAKIAYTKGGIPDIFVSIKDDNLDDPSDPNQTSWVSIKKGLQPAGNYAYTNAIDAPPDKNGNVGLSWIGLSKNDSTARILATDEEGDIVTAANLSDLNNYQPKGAYPITNADIKKPDENNNIGISWIGGWIDDKNVTRVRATDGIEGVVATCANLDDLDNYQEKGFYTPTFDPSAARNENKQVGIANFCSWNGSSDGKDRLQVTLGSGGNELTYVSARTDDLTNLQPKGDYVKTNESLTEPDESGNFGVGWIGLNKNSSVAHLLAKDDAGDLIEAANLSDLNGYQPKGSYPITNADITKPDENNNIGISWIGGWIDDKNVTRVRATDGIAGVVATCANLEDLDNYQPKGDYQAEGNYVSTNAPDSAADKNGNSGLDWFGFHTVNGKTNLLAAGGSGSGNLIETIPSFDDLSSYAKLPNGETNKFIQSGTTALTDADISTSSAKQFITFPQAFSSTPDVTIGFVDTGDLKNDNYKIWGISTTGFWIQTGGLPESVLWMAIGEI
ncbi:hypothetical protein FAI40_09995 [Acetobacteraceae bacterium]|nr:hypothetical protein FAI40_09995 [Acetobacteraceae bacterium]